MERGKAYSIEVKSDMDRCTAVFIFIVTMSKGILSVNVLSTRTNAITIYKREKIKIIPDEPLHAFLDVLMLFTRPDSVTDTVFSKINQSIFLPLLPHIFPS